MHSNQDLNSNLIKSLTSVHLPPPPSAHRQIIYNETLPPSSSPPRNFVPLSDVKHVEVKKTPKSDYLNSFEGVVLENPNTDKVLQKNKRRSAAKDELAAPLNTPPHTVSRSDSHTLKKQKTQTTPTMNNKRASKKAKNNPLSPQFSSPTPLITEQVEKPPAPTFTTAKLKKKHIPIDNAIVIETIPSPNKMPKVVFESDGKPPYSYATLIGMAILRGEERKLTLSQIYHWISSTFKYYRKNDVGWQNSIRHNLSLNKAFVKTEKSSDGKGHFWEVVSGYEMQFIKGKSGKRSFGVQLEPIEVVKPLKQNDPDDTSEDENNSEHEKPLAKLSQPLRLSAKTTAFSHDDDETSTSEYDDDEDDLYDNDYDKQYNNNDKIHDDLSRTPKAQIKYNECGFKNKPALKKSHTTLGLQSLNSNDYQQSTFSKLPEKRDMSRFYSTHTDNQIKKIPTLRAPETDWAASASGNHIVFGQLKPSFMVDSPPRATRLASFPSTSSFSCNTNFELSPLKRQETGPLLEPLSPSSRIQTLKGNETPSASIQPSAVLSNINKTPLRASSASVQNTTNSLLNSSQLNHFYNILKTPIARNIRTPNSNSIMRKFWNSPSQVDDFYTSPSIPRNTDDDYNYKVGLFGSPEKRKTRTRDSTMMFSHSMSPSLLRKVTSSSTSRSQNNGLFENSHNYGTSDLFGVDICTVVQRAVENEKHQKQQRLSMIESHSENATDEEEVEAKSTI